MGPHEGMAAVRHEGKRVSEEDGWLGDRYMHAPNGTTRFPSPTTTREEGRSLDLLRAAHGYLFPILRWPPSSFA